MYILIALLVFFSALFGLANSTAHYFELAVKNFEDKNKQIAEATSAYFRDISLPVLVDTVLSPEFSELKEKCRESGDSAPLSMYYQEKDLDDFTTKAREILTRMQDTFEIDSNYITYCDGSACYFVVGPYDYGILDGDVLAYNVPIEDIREKTTINLSYTEFVEPGTYGSERTVYWNMVTLSQIGEKDGDRTYWLASESDVLLLLKSELSYLFKTILFMIGLTIVCGLIGVRVLRRQLTTPIIKIKDNAVKFTSENSATKAAEPKDTGIKSNDELEDLSNSLYQLEENVSQTQDELRRVSEEKGRMQAELSIATAIQNGVLPSDFPDTDRYEIYALMNPAREVGGDFYDFFALDEDNLCLVIGDVSDKGIPAALFMMTSKTLLKTNAFNTHDPAKTLAIVNRALCDFNPAGMFVTVWMGILNTKTGLLTASNGGHEYPMFQLGDQPFEMMKDPHGLALAAMDIAKYKNYEVQMNPGDRLLVYSDGATDALDTNTKDFGVDRLLETVQKGAADSNAKGLVEAVKTRLEEYSAGVDQFDDITLLSVTYRGPGKEAEGTDMPDEAVREESAAE